MQATRWPSAASALPARSRGTGTWRTRPRPRSALARSRAAPPSVPVTKIRSPGRATSRRSARPGATDPITVSVSESCCARLRLPPASGQPCWAAASISPAASASKLRTDRLAGAASASRQPSGRAPIAARSDKLATSARRPTVPGLWLLRRKCTSSKKASVLATTCSPARMRSTAASSPIPSATLRAAPRRAAARAIRSISPNSPRSRSSTRGSVARARGGLWGPGAGGTRASVCRCPARRRPETGRTPCARISRRRLPRAPPPPVISRRRSVAPSARSSAISCTSESPCARGARS